ncbi:MAG: zinc-dependent metalloprotease [Vicinamibacteria bacterium]|nr:zinc-dependent metalloprotease [Vicinamibacteria bacterium]
MVHARGVLLAAALTAALAPAVRAADPLPTPAARTAGLQRHDGFVPFYWDARDGKLLLEVRSLEAEFLYGAGLAGGAGLLEASLDRGQLGELALARFERIGPRVLLHQRQTVHRSGVADAERTRAVEESFPSAILAALPIVAEGEGGLLVDATEFLLRDPGVVALLRGGKQGDWRQDVARSSFHFARTGAFPRNTEIEAQLTFAAEQPAAASAGVAPDGRTMTLRIHHTFLVLPEAGYTPLAYDPRVGTIPVRHLDHAAPITEPLERYLVTRWRLRKQDPAAALSAPVTPIVLHLDRGMPEPERSAVRAGALWWNAAFEKAGFKDAIVVRDLPDGASFLDARYTGIEWIHRAERAWSIGDFQTDPRTGEIVHGVARIDSARRRTTSRLWQNLPRGGERACLAADAPEFERALAAAGGDVDEESLVLQRLAYLSAHEVGHVLGFSHNWAGTTFGWGSVMDYLATNTKPLADGRVDLSDAFPKTVGVYDELMTRWAYTPSLDDAGRDALVRAAHAAGVVFPLESDPRWAEYDNGDPVQWLRTTQQVRRAMLARFGAAALPAGRPLYDLHVRFSLAYLYHRFGLQAAQQHVGGLYQQNALAGDGQVAKAWVPAAKQEEALALLLTALAPENLEVPDAALAALVAEPQATRRSREAFPSEAGDAFSPLAAARVLSGLIVRPLLEPQRAARLTLASEPGAPTLTTVLDRLVGATWGAAVPQRPALRPYLRVAQRVTLDALMELAAADEAAPEVRAVAYSRLERLRKRLAAAPTDAHEALALRDLAEFLDHPESRPARPAPLPVPPGRPIGAHGPRGE